LSYLHEVLKFIGCFSRPRDMALKQQVSLSGGFGGSVRRLPSRSAEPGFGSGCTAADK
jgi:hypothetical protein